jgi:hypothetical protein
MAEPTKNNAETMAEDTTQNAGARATQSDSEGEILLEEARNANEGKTPNSSGSQAPSTAEEHIPSRSDPEPSDLPSTG